MGQYFETKKTEIGRLQSLLEKAQTQLIDLYRQKQSIEEQIHETQEDVSHLSALCGLPVDDPVVQLGFTDSIRYVLGTKKGPMTNVEIREALEKAGYPLKGNSNPLSSILTILKRLEAANQIKLVSGDSRIARWEWCGGAPPQPPPPAAVAAAIDKARGAPE